MPWVKGQSGNPTGRPRRSIHQLAFEEMGRKVLVDYALPELVSIVRNRAQNPKLWAWAVEQLRDQCFLSQPRETNLDANIQSGVGSSPDELASEIAAIVPDAITPSAGGDPASGSRPEPGAVPVVRAEQSASEVQGCCRC